MVARASSARGSFQTRRAYRRRHRVALIGLSALLCGCSIKQYALTSVADALSSGAAGYATDNDVELIRDASPFSIKTIESLLLELPNHRGLLQSAASSLTQYSYAFVQLPAVYSEAADLDTAHQGFERAKRLYLRARDYALRGLELSRPGIRGQLIQGDAAALSQLTEADATSLYWCSVAWAGAIALAGDDIELIGDLPTVAALVTRMGELKPDFGDGDYLMFRTAFALALPAADEQSLEQAEQDYTTARELGGRIKVAPLVGYAEHIAVFRQDRQSFNEHLQLALTIETPDGSVHALSNAVYQRHARWLLENTDELFLE